MEFKKQKKRTKRKNERKTERQTERKKEKERKLRLLWGNIFLEIVIGVLKGGISSQGKDEICPIGHQSIMSN